MDQRWQVHIGNSGFQEFCLSVHFCYKEKMIRLIWLKKLPNFQNSNKNLKRRNQIILPKIILLFWYFKNDEVIQQT